MLPAFLYGDAVSNQAARIRHLLRDWGFRSRIYAEARDHRRVNPGADYRRYRGSPDNILVYHYTTGSAMTEFVRQLPDTVVIYYHNITPPEFLDTYNAAYAASLEQGRQELVLFRHLPFALAGSQYNRQEMLSLGFKEVAIMPYFIYLDELLAAADSSAGQRIASDYRDGWVNILFVGRLAPNKRQDDIIRTFNYYHRLVDCRSRLILVGSGDSIPEYRMELEVMLDVLDLQHVHLTGEVSLEELSGYYRAATVFLCLSEHEGFCVPLLEAMGFDIPVLAFKATGVPYTMGQSGVLVKRKRYDVIATLIDLLAHDTPLRRDIIASQNRRLSAFDHDSTVRSLHRQVERMMQLA